MGLRARILRVVGQTGPRKYNVLVGLARARTKRDMKAAKVIIDAMKREGDLVRVWNTKAALWDIRREPRPS